MICIMQIMGRLSLQDIKIFAPSVSVILHVREALADLALPIVFSPFTAISREYIEQQSHCLVCDWQPDLAAWDQQLLLSCSLRASSTFDQTGRWIEDTPGVITELLMNHKNDSTGTKARYLDADSFVTEADRLGFLVTGTLPAVIQQMCNGTWIGVMPEVLYNQKPIGMRVTPSKIATQIRRDKSPYEAIWTMTYMYLNPPNAKGSFSII